jgi:hypothetical protein
MLTLTREIRSGKKNEKKYKVPDVKILKKENMRGS